MCWKFGERFVLKRAPTGGEWYHQDPLSQKPVKGEEVVYIHSDRNHKGFIDPSGIKYNCHHFVTPERFEKLEGPVKALKHKTRRNLLEICGRYTSMTFFQRDMYMELKTVSKKGLEGLL